MNDASIRAGRHTVQISHPDKALFTEPTITKLQLARHYERMAPAMLPLIRDRPLALEAFPQGIAEPGFFMKSIPRHFPSWIATAKVPKRGGSLTQVLGQDTATLIYLAGQNVITPHLWLSRDGKPAAALIPIDEYEALEETAEVLSDVDLVHAIDEGLGELDRGETISLAELRRGLAGRREPS